MKKLIFIISISLFFIFSIPKTALAQGTFSCHWICSLIFICSCRVDPSSISCAEDNKPNNVICNANMTRGACDIDTDVTCIPCEPDDTHPSCQTLEPGDYFEPSLCDGDEGLMTAVGCIKFAPMRFLFDIKELIVPMIGGIAFLMMIIGAFFVLTSQGVPERLQRGREIITGAITGLFFIIFTWLILNLITGDLLGLFY